MQAFKDRSGLHVPQVPPGIDVEFSRFTLNAVKLADGLRSARSGAFAAAYSCGDSVEQPPQQPLDPPSAQFGQRDVNGGAVMQHQVGRVHERTCIAL